MSLAFKTAVTHAQMLQLLAPYFPSYLKEFSSGFRSAFSFTLPTASLRCALPMFGTISRFYAAMMLPLAGLAAALVVVAYDRSLGFTPWSTRALLHPSQLKKSRGRMFTRGRTFLQILVLTMSVVLYFLYPNLMAQNMEVWTAVAPSVSCVFDHRPSLDTGEMGLCGVSGANPLNLRMKCRAIVLSLTIWGDERCSFPENRIVGISVTCTSGKDIVCLGSGEKTVTRSLAPSALHFILPDGFVVPIS